MNGERALFPARHRSEQYLTSSQTRAHFLRQLNGRPQVRQDLLGKSDFVNRFFVSRSIVRALFNGDLQDHFRVLEGVKVPAHAHTSGTLSVSTALTNGTLVGRASQLIGLVASALQALSGSTYWTLYQPTLDTLSLASGAVSGTTANAGGGATHSNLQPTWIKPKIIKL